MIEWKLIIFSLLFLIIFSFDLTQDIGWKIICTFLIIFGSYVKSYIPLFRVVYFEDILFSWLCFFHKIVIFLVGPSDKAVIRLAIVDFFTPIVHKHSSFLFGLFFKALICFSDAKFFDKQYGNSCFYSPLYDSWTWWKYPYDPRKIDQTTSQPRTTSLLIYKTISINLTYQYRVRLQIDAERVAFCVDGHIITWLIWCLYFVEDSSKPFIIKKKMKFC